MSLPPSYFEVIYGHSDDPWGFRTRWYEARKRQLTLASLQCARYATAFEPGCSIGVLSKELSSRVDHLLAMDVSSRALEIARQALPGHAETREGRVPEDWPDGSFDLVVVSEVAYYLDAEACGSLAERACGSAGELIVVHWRHPVEDYPLGGDQVEATFTAAAAAHGLQQMLSHVEPDFRIDTWCRDRRSPASRAGLVPR